ncbi:MAG: hypothetical protein ACRCSN_13470 [Dermatophilaceae bacterium]
MPGDPSISTSVAGPGPGVAGSGSEERQVAAAGPTLLAAVSSLAVVTVVTVVVTTLWAHLTSTTPFESASPDLDPRFELRDRLVWVVSLGAAAAAGLLLAAPRFGGARLATVLRSTPVVALTVVGAVGVALSAAWSDRTFGLGPANLLLAAVVGPVLLLAFAPVAEPATRWLWAPVLVLVTAVYLPALWQTPSGMYDPMHGSRVVDEVLGPAAGNLPLSDYIPQYGGMLGLPLALVPGVVASSPAWAVLSLLSVLAIATVAALCAVAALMLPPGRRGLAPLLVVPVLLMKPSAPEALLPAGVQRLFQSIPERSLLPVLAGMLLLLAASRPRSRRWWPWVGVAAGVAALNNVESGATATLALAMALVALRPGWRATGLTAAGWAGAVLAYLLLVVLGGGTARFEYWVGFSLEFAAGFANVAMPPYGNYVLVLFILAAGTASGFAVLRRRTGRLTVAALGGFYFGAWGLLMFPYYVGRSASMGQLQFFLIPSAVVAVWLLVGAAWVVTAPRPLPRRWAPALLLCVLPAAVFATTVVKAPSPAQSLDRMTKEFGAASNFRSSAWARQPVVDAEQARVIREVAAPLPQPAGVFFTSGNVASLRTGLPNVSVLAVPEELLSPRPWSGDPQDDGNATFRRIQCEALSRSDIRSVISEDFIAEAVAGCPGWERTGVERGYVVVTRTDQAPG